MDWTHLLGRVKDEIFNDPSTPHRQGHDPSGLIGRIESLFGQFGGGGAQQQQPNVRPASQDPYGDPALQGASYPYVEGQDPRFGNVRPASEDPLGDPAFQQGGGQFGNVRPASEDPLGDPADQERRYR